LLGILPALIFDGTTFSSGGCCEPNIPPYGAILVVLSGDQFVYIIYERAENKLSI
jgi:hypothetical protein